MGWGFFPLALLAKLPYAMSVVAVMTSVSAVTGSYAQAGATAALVGVGTAVSGPLLGAAADKYGQRPVLLLSATLNAIAIYGLALGLRGSAAAWVLLVIGLLIGLTAPQASSMVRSRWLLAIGVRIEPARQAKATSAVLSYESMTDEFMFVLGPVVTGAIAVALGVVVPLEAAALLTVVGGVGFGVHRSVQFARGRRFDLKHSTAADAPEADPIRDLFRARILVPVAGMVTIGFFFGAMLASLTGFMEVRGEAAATGIYYGIMGVGSAILALGTVWLPVDFTLSRRWASFSAVMVAGAVLLLTVRGLTGTVLAMVVMGCGVGPTLVTLFSIASEVAPLGRVTTVMAMMSTGVVVGQALASVVAGAALDASGFEAGYHLVAGATVVLFVLWVAYALQGKRRRRRHSFQ